MVNAACGERRAERCSSLDEICERALSFRCLAFGLFLWTLYLLDLDSKLSDAQMAGVQWFFFFFFFYSSLLVSQQYLLPEMVPQAWYTSRLSGADEP